MSAVADLESAAALSAFLEDLDVDQLSPRTTLGRFGDVSNYEPGNYAWRTPKEQGAEQRKKRASSA